MQYVQNQLIFDIFLHTDFDIQKTAGLPGISTEWKPDHAVNAMFRTVFFMLLVRRMR